MRQGLTSLGLYETRKEKVLCLMAYHLQETFCICCVTARALLTHALLTNALLTQRSKKAKKTDNDVES